MTTTTMPPQTSAQIANKPQKKRVNWAMAIIFAVLTIIAIGMSLPFVWQVLTSFKTLADASSPTFWPQNGWFPSNYPRVFEEVPFGRYYLNSVMISVWVTLLQVSTSALAAYAFARLQWPGRDKVFLLYLATMMIPGVVLMVPNFYLMLKFGMYNTYTGQIIPAAFSAFGTFLLRQFMMGLPSSLDEAAEIDGASEWQVFTEVILPLARPGLIVLAIFTFIGNYNSFFWPLITIKDEALRTLPLGMLFFDGAYGQETNLLMAASLMSIAPLIVIYITLQKHLVKGIQLGAVKG